MRQSHQLELPLAIYELVCCSHAGGDQEGQLEFPLIVYGSDVFHDSELHHLLKRSEDRNYCLRLIIYQGPKMVGKRVTRSLHTKDPKVAIRRRDAVLKELREKGQLCPRTIALLDRTNSKASVSHKSE